MLHVLSCLKIVLVEISQTNSSVELNKNKLNCIMKISVIDTSKFWLNELNIFLSFGIPFKLDLVFSAGGRWTTIVFRTRGFICIII